uniref:Peptidase S1 domain-containing protein n=1 Tax=Neobodo designis TaxID=312471 RepID=A0A6U4UBD8_NEODS|mmetsp:Transcript_40187/g.124182  ORF Transcript_40187/g.124182 Transcript_40187/m.124182 type:complete len:325 (+) Transcript_40187:42-1016(+)
MPRLPVVSSLSGIWPIASYLHVPKHMPAPNWLMLGSAFAIDKGSLNLNPAFAAKHDVLLLTAAHSFSPWRCFKLNIPEDWRKARYVTGKVMQYDAHGSADVTRTCELGVVAVHPTVDVALVKVMKPDEFRKQCAAGPKDAPPAEEGEAADVNDVFGTFRLTTPDFATDDALVTSSIMGFRGRGSLGNTEWPSEEAVKAMPAEQRKALMEEQRNAVGKQDYNVCQVSLVKDPPVTDVPPLVPTSDAGELKGPASSIYSRAAVKSGSCYAGMSGSPLVFGPLIAEQPGQPRDAAGLLFQSGLKEKRNTEVLYVPSSAMIPWLESLK